MSVSVYSSGDNHPPPCWASRGFHRSSLQVVAMQSHLNKQSSPSVWTAGDLPCSRGRPKPRSSCSVCATADAAQVYVHSDSGWHLCTFSSLSQVGCRLDGLVKVMCSLSFFFPGFLCPKLSPFLSRLILLCSTRLLYYLPVYLPTVHLTGCIHENNLRVNSLERTSSVHLARWPDDSVKRVLCNSELELCELWVTQYLLSPVFHRWGVRDILNPLVLYFCG